MTKKFWTKKSRFVSAAIALATLAGASLATAPANAANKVAASRVWYIESVSSWRVMWLGRA